MPRWETSSTEALVHLLIFSLDNTVYECAIQMEEEAHRGEIAGWDDSVQEERL